MMYTTHDYTGKVISKWKLVQVLAVEKVLHSCYNNEIQDVHFWPSNWSILFRQSSVIWVDSVHSNTSVPICRIFTVFSLLLFETAE